MYCIQCGVKLADTENICPLCGTKVFHPDLVRGEVAGLYPVEKEAIPKVSPWGALVVTSTAFLLPMVITLLCDLRISQTVTWSGYVLGALAVVYVAAVLPFWFRKPNPVIFVPCDFAAVAVYVLYINYATGGTWFLGFALPVIIGAGLIVCTVITLLRYLRRGRLYIFGGAIAAFGGLMLLMELRMMRVFQLSRFVGWSLYPLTVLTLLGGMLIFLAICRPARETMQRKFFL